jgi:hypothetical protein
MGFTKVQKLINNNDLKFLKGSTWALKTKTYANFNKEIHAYLESNLKSDL